MHTNLSQSCSTDEGVSKGIIVNETLSQSCFVNKCFKEEDKSECTIKKQKDTKDEVTYDMPKYFNAFNVLKCGIKLLDRLDMSYERACMVTERKVYFTNMLESILDYNTRHDTPLSSKNIPEEVIRFMSGTEEEEKDAKHNVNNVTMDNLFQSPITISAQKKNANMTN